MNKIVFFGDSNTWGYNSETTEQYPDTVRYIGLLRARMQNCEIIDEGLNGRTNALEDPFEPGRNGSEALPGILRRHDPFDLFVIMLGTNDTKAMYEQSAAEIASAMERNVTLALSPEQWGGSHKPAVLIVCPPGVTEDILGSPMSDQFDLRSVQVSKELDREYREAAQRCGCACLNAMAYTGPGKRDGVHLDEEGHRKLADALEIKITDLLHL